MYHSTDINSLHRVGAVRLPVTFKLPVTFCSLHVPGEEAGILLAKSY